MLLLDLISWCISSFPEISTAVHSTVYVFIVLLSLVVGTATSFGLEVLSFVVHLPCAC